MCYSQEKYSPANTWEDDFVMISIQGTWRLTSWPRKQFPFSRRREVNQSFFENIPFPATPNVEKKFGSLCKTLESTFEMRLIMKFYLCIMPNSSERSNLFSLHSIREVSVFPLQLSFGTLYYKPYHSSINSVHVNVNDSCRVRFLRLRTALHVISLDFCLVFYPCELHIK